MLHRSQECIKRLARQRSARCVGYGNAQHDGYASARYLFYVACGHKGSLRVERVEYCFYQEDVRPALTQYQHLFLVGCAQLVEGEGAVGRVLYIGRHGQGAVGGAYRRRHIARAVWGDGRHAVSLRPCQLYSSLVNLSDVVLGLIVGLRDALGVKCVGADDVSPSLQIVAVYLAEHIWSRKTYQVIVAMKSDRPVSKELTAEVVLGQLVALYHGAHGTV